MSRLSLCSQEGLCASLYPHTVHNKCGFKKKQLGLNTSNLCPNIKKES